MTGDPDTTDEYQIPPPDPEAVIGDDTDAADAEDVEAPAQGASEWRYTGEKR